MNNELKTYKDDVREVIEKFNDLSNRKYHRYKNATNIMSIDKDGSINVSSYKNEEIKNIIDKLIEIENIKNNFDNAKANIDRKLSEIDIDSLDESDRNKLDLISGFFQESELKELLEPKLEKYDINLIKDKNNLGFFDKFQTSGLKTFFLSDNDVEKVVADLEKINRYVDNPNNKNRDDILKEMAINKEELEYSLTQRWHKAGGKRNTFTVGVGISDLLDLNIENIKSLDKKLEILREGFNYLGDLLSNVYEISEKQNMNKKLDNEINFLDR